MFKKTSVIDIETYEPNVNNIFDFTFEFLGKDFIGITGLKYYVVKVSNLKGYVHKGDYGYILLETPVMGDYQIYVEGKSHETVLMMFRQIL